MTWVPPNIHFAVHQILTSPDMNDVSTDLSYVYGDTSWIAVASFSNGWSNFGSGVTAAGYRKVGTVVFLRGGITGGSANTAAFTLPTGYRPIGIEEFAVAAGGSFAQWKVDSSGVVTQQAGGTGINDLSTIHFDTL
jgi:hypothetical protein